MKTRISIAVAVLVLAVVFGFIFWNQFSNSQQTLAGANPNPVSSNSNSSNQAAIKSDVPTNDSLDAIGTDLSGVDTNIDSDSSQMDAQLNGF
ncbi:MAG TPA: hypothetical protein VFX17_03620 [Patescibacteria group bacterium]|nr:hypothetical protein [Patescibacteria group bacterium]